MLAYSPVLITQMNATSFAGLKCFSCKSTKIVDGNNEILIILTSDRLTLFVPFQLGDAQHQSTCRISVSSLLRGADRLS